MAATSSCGRWLGLWAILVLAAAVRADYRVFAEDGQELALSGAAVLSRMRRAASNSSTGTTEMPTTSTANPLSLAKVVKDDHLYYKSSIIIDGDVATNYMRAFKEAYTVKYKKHSVLSNSHRMALQIKISFDFLFYGHKVNKITIATGGFLYMSHYLHKYLTYSQYIAPLMADFHPGLGSGDVKYADTGSALFVMWEDVLLKTQTDKGKYTFEAILHKNGTIVFAYKRVPSPVTSIDASVHTVRIGIADAYYNDTDHPTDKSYFTRKIIQYHKVDIKKTYVTSNTVVILHPLETCVQQATCDKCVSSKTTFNCAWCSRVSRCSSGTDRMKQSWHTNSCHQVNTKSSCPFTPLEAGMIVFVVIIVLILLAVLAAFGYWVYYAYSHPATPSGMWLMEHRPTVLMSRFAAWRRGGEPNGASADIYRVESTA